MYIIMLQVSSRSEAHSELNSFRRKSESALIISGSSLELCIKHYEQVSSACVREREREGGGGGGGGGEALCCLSLVVLVYYYRSL